MDAFGAKVDMLNLLSIMLDGSFGRKKMEEIIDFTGITFQAFSLNVDDAAYFLIKNNDIYCQVHAIQRMNKYLLSESKDHHYEIEELKKNVKNSSGIQGCFLEDELISEYQFASYYAIARSMCVVGITTSGYESVFCEVFGNIKNIFGEGLLNNKCNRSLLKPAKRWDCHFYIGDNVSEKKGLGTGIQQLLIETELAKFLPSNMNLILDALFSYRNAVMHNGFDWPEVELENFTSRKNNWPSEWIGVTTSHENPWLYNLTNKFHKIVIDLFGEIYKAAGKYYLEKKEKFSI